MRKIYIKKGIELSKDEIEEINRAKAREFKIPPMPEEQKIKTLFFLLKEKERLLAMGELIPLEPIEFNRETFFILGIGGIVANEKGKGYGRQIISAIRTYLREHDKTGVGSCGWHNQGFYEKCGLGVDLHSLKRFVFQDKGKKIINIADDCVIYQDGSDRFMEKVLSTPNKEVLLKRPFNW